MRVLKLVAIVALFASCAFAQKQAPLPKDLPPYGPEKTLEAPAVKIAKLDNGLTVWLVSKPGFPKLSYAVAVRGGFAADPNDRPGISELLSNTIDQGTKSRKGPENRGRISGRRRRSKRHGLSRRYRSFDDGSRR